jgi:hypothetical protein
MYRPPIVWKGTNGSTWSTKLQTLTKGQTVANLTNVEAKELDARTKVVTNFIDALDRNLGADSEFGNGWYNEAWDGFAVCKVETVYNVGFKDPAVRSAAIDTKITPTKTSQADLFTKAYVSGFKTNNKSTIRVNKPDGYVGSFEGKDIILPDMSNMYVSRKFYIPNATVQDLLN